MQSLGRGHIPLRGNVRDACCRTLYRRLGGLFVGALAGCFFGGGGGGGRLAGTALAGTAATTAFVTGTSGTGAVVPGGGARRTV